MTGDPYRVLFLCTGNSARSILGEYLLRHVDVERFGGGRFAAASAGARPTGRVHPLALRVLADDYGIDASDAVSQSVHAYADDDFDLVITVCDHARDQCPIFPGGGFPRRGTMETLRVHWGSEDPAAFEGSEDAALAVFRRVAREIEHRVRRLVELPLAELEPAELEARLEQIGRETTFPPGLPPWMIRP